LSQPYRHARFTPPGAKYLILDDFHFRIDPQIINYNGLSFHTSMGLESGRAALPFRIYTIELINFVCFTFRTSPLRIFFFHSTPKIINIGVKRARQYGIAKQKENLLKSYLQGLSSNWAK
jgi:hypothetical protein